MKKVYRTVSLNIDLMDLLDICKSHYTANNIKISCIRAILKFILDILNQFCTIITNIRALPDDVSLQYVNHITYAHSSVPVFY